MISEAENPTRVTLPTSKSADHSTIEREADEEEQSASNSSHQLNSVSGSEVNSHEDFEVSTEESKSSNTSQQNVHKFAFLRANSEPDLNVLSSQQTDSQPPHQQHQPQLSPFTSAGSERSEVSLDVSDFTVDFSGSKGSSDFGEEV